MALSLRRRRSHRARVVDEICEDTISNETIRLPSIREEGAGLQR